MAVWQDAMPRLVFVTKGVFMKKALLLAASVAFIAPQAFAQAKNFEGFSVGANLAVAKSTTEPTGVASESGNTNSLDLQAQYSLALAPQFVLGLGLTLGTGNNKAGTFATGDESITKNRMSLDIIPGYALSNNMLVFGKVSMLSADGASTTAAGVETKKSLSGVGYGFGLRGMIDKNMFYQLGYDINKYNDVEYVPGTSVKGTSSVFSLGVGYKF
jgi:outer membrane immunogenic protein